MTAGIPRSIRQSIVFIDTTAHYALLDRGDRHHEDANNLWRSLGTRKLRPITSNFVLAESHALILHHLGYGRAKDFVERLRSSVRIEPVAAGDEDRAWEIITAYSDKNFTYVDATSFAMMERFDVRTAFAFDRHFGQYGFSVLT